jgi:hypothetical protein
MLSSSCSSYASVSLFVKQAQTELLLCHCITHISAVGGADVTFDATTLPSPCSSILSQSENESQMVRVLLCGELYFLDWDLRHRKWGRSSREESRTHIIEELVCGFFLFGGTGI